MNSIFNRRSIRKYTEQEVSDKVIEQLLKAAMAAPSAGNEQPWQYIVIRDRETMNAIPKFHPYSQMLKEASAAIVVCGDSSLEKFQGYWVQDCSAATQNILLEAQELGLGSVWLGVYPDEGRVDALKKLLGLPVYVTPLCILPIGYPAEQRQGADRYDSARIHHDRW